MRIDDVKLWHIQKKYENTYFNDDETSLGYKITVYQDSINNEIDEYLVNFNYFKQIMNKYGFTCIDSYETNINGKKYKLNSIDSFEKIYNLNNIDKSDYKLSDSEKIISFLNNYFIFKRTTVRTCKT